MALWNERLPYLVSYSKELTIERFGEPLLSTDRVILTCCDCGCTGEATVATATTYFFNRPYRCRSCGCKKRKTVDWEARLKGLGFLPEKTLSRYGYEYPEKSCQNIVLTCSVCNVDIESSVEGYWRRRAREIKCKTCTARENIAKGCGKGSEALKEFWSKEENRQWMSNLSKAQPHRRENVRKLNSDKKHRKKIADALKRPEVREKISSAMKMDWKINRSSRLEAEKRGRSKRLETLRETVSSPEHRGMLSERQRRNWEDPNYRDKQKSRWTPAERKRMSELMRSPEMAAKVCAGSTISSEESLINFFLTSLGLKVIPQYVDFVYSFDFYLPDYKIYVDFNGHKWHHPKYVQQKAEKNIARDKAKTTWVKKHRPECRYITLTEDDVYSKGGICRVFSEFMQQQDFQFSTLEVRDDVEDKDAVKFLHLFHYKERSKAAPGYKVGAYCGGKLIGLAVYSTAVRQEVATSEGLRYKEVLELSRFCLHPCYQKKNFASWMLAKSRDYVRRKFPYVRALITFADTTMDHDGTIYKAAGFEFLHETAPDYHYINSVGTFMHKRTLWGLASKLKVAEKEYAHRHGWIKVFGAKKLKFIYRLD